MKKLLARMTDRNTAPKETEEASEVPVTRAEIRALFARELEAPRRFA